MECFTCNKTFSIKTLEKNRGKYCKTCFFNVLKNENNAYKNLIFKNKIFD